MPEEVSLDRIERILEDILEELKFVGQRLSEVEQAGASPARICHTEQHCLNCGRRHKPGESPWDSVIRDW